MATYEITTPNGGVYEIEAPDNATEAQVLAFARKQLSPIVNVANSQQQPAKTGKEAFPQALRETLREAGPVARNLAAVGTAPSNLYQGIKQIFGSGDEDRIRANRIMAEEAPIGAVAGNVATYAPLAAIPGANTVLGGGAIGGATGALQPVLEGESRGMNALTGAIGGAAVPAAIRAGKAVKAAAIDPFTDAGKDRIARGVLARAAGDKEQSLVNLLRNKGQTPGFQPTVGQASGDAGLAALERSARAVDPGAFQATESSQRQAIAEALRNVAGTPEARKAAIESRESAANALYGKAFQSDAMRRNMAAQNAAGRAPFSGVGVSAKPDDLATPGLRALAERPIFKQALQEAKTMAANKGIRLDDPLSSLEGLHYTKLALDDMANPTAMNAMGKNANAAVNSVRDQLTKELETVAPAYGAARSTFKDLSQPINQMDIGQELVNRTIPAIYRDMPAPQQINANQFAKLINEGGNDLARNVTGMKSATLEGVMSPEQMQALRGVGSDLQLMKVGENLGRGPGSDTVQKAAMSHLAAEAGVPNWMASVARVPGGVIRDMGNALYGSANKDVAQRLAEILRNPQQAATLMQQAEKGVPEAVNLLRMGAQGAGFAAPAMLQ